VIRFESHLVVGRFVMERFLCEFWRFMVAGTVLSHSLFEQRALLLLPVGPYLVSLLSSEVPAYFDIPVLNNIQGARGIDARF
jgi:hypothetical protein